MSYKLITYTDKNESWDSINSILYYHKLDNALKAGKRYFVRKVIERLNSADWSLEDMEPSYSTMEEVEKDCIIYSEKYDTVTAYVPDCLCDEPDIVFTISPVVPIHFED